MFKCSWFLAFCLVSSIDPHSLQSEFRKIASQSRTAWIATSNSRLLDVPYSSPDEMFALSEQQGISRVGNQGVVVYYSGWLSPITESPEVAGEVAYLRQLIPILKSVKNPSFEEFGNRNALVLDASTIGSVQWSKLATAWPAFSAQQRTAVAQTSGTKMTLDVQPRLMVFDSQGRLVEELNLARSLKAQRTLLPLLRELPGVILPRFPAELAASFDDLQLKIPAGDGTRKLGDLINELQPHCRHPLTIDERITDLLIMTKSEGQPMDFREVARLLPELLDLYWRPVGNRFHLAISADDPLRVSTSRGGSGHRALMIDLVKEFQRFALVDTAASPDQIAGASFGLEKASPAAVDSIIETYLDLGKDATKFGMVLKEARAKGGYTIKLVYTVGTTYSGPGIQLGRFFDAG